MIVAGFKLILSNHRDNKRFCSVGRCSDVSYFYLRIPVDVLSTRRVNAEYEENIRV